MPECHLCPLNGKKSKRCITCAKKGPPPSTNKRGLNLVVVDYDLKQPECDQTPLLDLPDCCEDTVRRLLAVFSSLNPLDLSLVFAMLRRTNVAVWSRKHHKLHPASFLRLKKIVKLHPELKCFYKTVEKRQ